MWRCCCGSSAFSYTPLSALPPPQQPMRTGSSLGRSGEQGPWLQGWRPGQVHWTSSERPEWGRWGSCALQCSLAENSPGKRMPSDSWEASAGKLQWWQEAGSLPHPVVRSGGYLWLWCPVLWGRVVLCEVEAVAAFHHPSHRGYGGGIKAKCFSDALQ